MTVYERDRKGDACPKYFVLNKLTGRMLEEFRRFKSAEKFARENKKG